MLIQDITPRNKSSGKDLKLRRAKSRRLILISA